MLEGKYADAEKLNRQTFDVRSRVLGAQHPETLLSTYNLAGSIHDQGRLAEAENSTAKFPWLSRKSLGQTMWTA